MALRKALVCSTLEVTRGHALGSDFDFTPLGARALLVSLGAITRWNKFVGDAGPLVPDLADIYTDTGQFLFYAA